MNEPTLLALIATLIASQTLVVKWLMARSDKLVQHLANAVATFQSFEATEDAVHASITTALADLSRTSAAQALTMERILKLLTAHYKEHHEP